MTSTTNFKNLSKSFVHEQKVLLALGINSWFQVMELKDQEIYTITRKSLATTRNLKRLRCIAMLIHTIKVSQEDAALLMHSGIASIEALAAITPEELVKRTSRLERFLKTNRKPRIGFKQAQLLIQSAQNRQIDN